MASGTDNIAAAFAEAQGRAALMPYLMGGFPDLDASAAIGEACADAGADLVELGVPFSDPLADGPVIHAAGTRALHAGATLRGVLGVAGRIAERLPVVVMCYANLIYARGVERFARELADAGGSGLIVPDLPLEEAGAVREACDAADLALVPLVAPTTPDDRMAEIAAGARGFLYTVSVTGTTGERAAVDGSLASLLERAKRHCPVPVAVGFGISSGEHAAQAAAAGADGVIVGSWLVRAATEAADAGASPAAAAGDVVATLAAALRR
ncbi:MAG TPA: tryptophan synthase subunit alpha [Solirubrobacteraceae bacterium]|nr:tryptophan synthase subunit alpha [Solirubrobacteraceae bacterium]